ncbi:sensor histidine kinase [Bradyrhizobium elkanii]|uniref:sensor histidine kinase n=1 Tax=Bradyrhizobium elkanii TaxID=29448 RepID=UPI000841A688|nr:ATP-binding protein [Bradyrhizobium elkanii]ODM84103.1 hypothetical protein A6452_15030 [Bradyrhizobium elkanii]
MSGAHRILQDAPQFGDAYSENPLVLQSKDEFESEGARCESFRETIRGDNSMHLMDQLASGVAHDLNNRLHNMASALSLMRTRVAAGCTSDLDSLIEVAERSLASASKLAHHLMNVGRKTGFQADNVFQLNDALISMSDLLHCAAGESVDLRLVMSASTTEIRCDPHLLECAIINLVINSRDAMPRGGIISIETSTTCPSEGDDGHRYVSLCVTDSGDGISSDIIEKVFEPFLTTKPNGVGTGLGLAMVRHFVDQARGRIEVRSTPQQGTCIKIHLPIAIEG